MLNLSVRYRCGQSCLAAIEVMGVPGARKDGNAVAKTIEAEPGEFGVQTHRVAFLSAGRGLVGLAGLWNPWNDKASGELRKSFTVRTPNSDSLEVCS